MTPTAQTHRMTEALRAHYAAALRDAFRGTRFHTTLSAAGNECETRPDFTLYVDGGDTSMENAEAMARAVGLLRGLTEARVRRIRVKGRTSWLVGADTFFQGDIRRGVRWSESGS